MTGGGTSGHVTPNMALIPTLQMNNFEIHYIGSENGIEKELITKINIPYHSISAGKLRRYFDLKNVTDLAKVLKGFGEALRLIARLKPDIVFSKGGFVAAPVVWAAFICKIPVIIHESDITPGLANKLSMPFATKVCYTFPETKSFISDNKGVLTGIPVRQSLLSGREQTGKQICNFSNEKPVIVVIGGSQGSGRINSIVRQSLDELLQSFQVCHICGRGGIERNLLDKKGYMQFEYTNEELPHLFAMAESVISRAGATTIFELLALRKPNILIPLPIDVSRGDQVLNAQSFEKQGFSHVLDEKELDNKGLMNSVLHVYKNRSTYVRAMQKSTFNNGIERVLSVIRLLINNF